ncbi:hypothetical protein [Leucobacter massiliensis]|uniref:GAP family protein n=1 Tax=Leucobacter massiliensis TaxID=1686285 RepID=A0A2S9QLB6_9MICO|nr:hypothetical protein [Leucobacter massiliensis]PRI10379.1 hypothetical protein B4915_12045 [Leucobacter massiliensis]
MPELLKWLGAVPVLLGFALTVGINPSTSAATVDVLVRRTRWLPRVCWMTGGLALGATLLFVLFLFVNPTTFVEDVEGRVTRVVRDRALDAVAGAALLAAATAVAAWRLLRPGLPPRRRRPVRGHEPAGVYFALGLTSSFTGFTPLPVMYLTGRVVSSLGPAWLPQLVAYLLFVCVLVAPYFALGLAWTHLPALASRIAAGFDRLQRWDYRWAVAGFLAVAGAVVLGLVVFTGR